MRSLLWGILFCFSMHSVEATDSARADIPSLIADMDKKVAVGIENKQLVGCAIAVVKGKEVVFEKFYGTRDNRTAKPLNRQTVFQLGSVSKPIAATLVHVLQHNNKLRVDERVSILFPFMHPHTEVSHLLSHSSGYARAGWNQRIESLPTRNHLLDNLKKETQQQPGLQFDYHNFVYSLLEDYLQSKTQKSFALLMHEQLFMPLGMMRASIGLEAFLREPNKAWSHQLVRKKRQYDCIACLKPSQDYHHKVPSAGGVNASLGDLIAFMHLHLSGQEKTLPREEVESMYKPRIHVLDFHVHHRFPKGTRHAYGHGWRTAILPRGEIIVYHGGHLKGILNFIGFVPHTKVGVIVLNNSDNPLAAKAGLAFLMTHLGYQASTANRGFINEHKRQKAKKASKKVSKRNRAGKAKTIKVL